VPKTNIGVTTVSSTNDVGKLDIYMEQTETSSLSLTQYKNQFKMDQRSSCKTQNFEMTKGRHTENT
jgi:hypothetical protein